MSFGKGKEEPSLAAASAGSGISSSLSGGIGQPRADAFLGRGTKIIGTLMFAGPVEIEGAVEGEIIAQERLVLGESSIVKGKVSGAEIIVKGDVNGDIHASRRLTLRRPARIVGNISSPLISMEEGVTFDGKCAMVSAQKLEGHAGEGRHGGEGKSDGKVVPIAERAA